MATDYRELVEGVIEDNRYLALSTTDGESPWVAPVEYIRSDDGTFYFFSPTDSRHARHVEANQTVAVAIWSPDQPEYSADLDATLNGVQIRGEARRLSADDHPDVVADAVEALDPPMPPYAAFEIEPQRAYAPVVAEGVNERVEVDLD
jgi:nitroimidazol reductase NimA-like FMN-containing flavoprotein (pyridoxamine 5'-phosphate oxidase superfamily)